MIGDGVSNYRIAHTDIQIEFLTKGEFEMDWSTIADYFTITFFLWYGLKGFISALGSDMFMKVGSVVALIAAVTTFLSL